MRVLEKNSLPVIPVVLFAYARSDHLVRVLACLRENAVPLIYAFADGAKGPADTLLVNKTRALLRAVDWCEIRLHERPKNLGLGKNVLAGVTEVAASHEMFVVWEDDLICVPGTYAWLSAALRHYVNDSQVMSVTGWIHPRVVPKNISGSSYFDGRAECWVWGAYARSWRGMEQSALSKMKIAQASGIPPNIYGFDLPEMARIEADKNIWAVRWLYHHIQNKGLCLRPPWSMVEHIGFDRSATNAGSPDGWNNPPLREAPKAGWWPLVKENPSCPRLWRRAYPGRWGRKWRRLKTMLIGG
jgi:hypothetical protein